MDCFKSSGSSGDFQLSQEAGGWWSQGLLCSLQVFLAWVWPPPNEEADRQTPTFVGTDALTVVDVKSTIQAHLGILQELIQVFVYFAYFLGEEKQKALVSRSLLAGTAVEHLASARTATRR